MRNKLFYYTIPLDNQNTLFYTYFKKYLFKISKSELDKIILKVLYKQKYEKKYTPIAEILKLSFKEGKTYNIRKKYLNKNGNVLERKLFNYFISCKRHILIGENIRIQRDIKKLLENNHWVVSKRKFSNFFKDNDFKLIIGSIYDKDIINFLEKNKELFINTFCCLIGIDEMYILKLSKSFCINCFLLRKTVNQKNLLENLLLTNYLRKEKNRILLNSAQLFLIINYTINYAAGRNIVIKNMISQKMSFHNKITPFPFCSICKNKTYKEDVPRYVVIDNRIGIINKIKTEKVRIGKIKFYISTTKISNIIPVFRLSIFNFNKLPINKISQFIIKRAVYTEFSSWRPLICGSVSTDKKLSEKKAINESIERYCAALCLKKYLVFSSYQNLQSKAVNPRKWILFNRDQYQNRLFPYKPFTENSKTYWVYGSILRTGKRIYLPAPFTFIRYFFDKKEERIGIYPTTGLACGNKEENVFLSSICENVERDACMLTWLLRIPPKKILSIDDKQIKNRFKNFKASNINLHLFELSLDIRIPVVLALGINNNKKGPRILVGSACKPKLKDAILRAIDELTQGFTWRYLMNEYKNYDFGKNFENITHFEHRALFYSRLRDLSILNFILETERTLNYRNFKTKAITYKDVANVVYKAGFNIFCVDLTSSDISPTGLKVYKILIPGLQPLNSNHNTPFLNPKRIKRINNYLDLNKIGHSKDINSYPHPFT